MSRALGQLGKFVHRIEKRALSQDQSRRASGTKRKDLSGDYVWTVPEIEELLIKARNQKRPRSVAITMISEKVKLSKTRIRQIACQPQVNWPRER
jgi:hypothetical protein